MDFICPDAEVGGCRPLGIMRGGGCSPGVRERPYHYLEGGLEDFLKKKSGAAFDRKKIS